MNGFSVLLAFGAVIGLGWAVWLAPGKRASRYVDIGLGLLAGALLGGRVLFVALNWPYFRLHPLEIGQVWLGGLSGAGALFGGLLAVALAATLTRQPLGALADLYLPLVMSVTISAWLGCWLAGAAYGHALASGWGMPARDEWGGLSLRFPLQLLGALLTLLLFYLLDQARQKNRSLLRRNRLALFRCLSRPGLVSGLALLGLGLELAGLSLLRADPGMAWRGLRLEVWGGLALAALGLVWSLLVFLPRPEKIFARFGKPVAG